MSSQDARVWAWMQAWDHLEAATKVQKIYSDRDTDSAVGKLHRAAELYALLADCADSVGEGAADILVQRREQERAHRRQMDEFLKGAES